MYTEKKLTKLKKTEIVSLGPIPTPDPDSIVCTTTAAPTTTAFFTSTVSLSGSTQSSGTVNPSQPTDGSTASPSSTGTTVTDPNASTGSVSDSKLSWCKETSEFLQQVPQLQGVIQ